MGSGNLRAEGKEQRAKSEELSVEGKRRTILRSMLYALCSMLSLCLVSFCVSADSSLESLPNIIGTMFENAKLKEEINLTGATLKELTGEHPDLSGLKQMSLKAYQMPTPPGEAEIEAVSTAYRDRLVGEGWQTILRRRDESRTVLIYGKEKQGVREELLIVLITSSEISEMVLVGQIELSALGELREVILRSMPEFDKAQPIADFLTPGPSPSQEIITAPFDVINIIRQLEEVIEVQGEQTPLEVYYQLGAAYQQAGRYKEALVYYDSIINRAGAPEWMLIRTYQDAAKCSERLGKRNDAKVYYQMLMNMFSEQTDIVASAQAFLNRLEGKRVELRAETPMEKAEKLIYEHGKYEKAIRAYQEIIDSMPDSSDAKSAQLMIGMIYGYVNQPEKKIEAFGKAVKEYPSAVSHKHLAMAYQGEGMYEEALKQYKVIMSDYPTSPESTDAYLNAGECSEKLGMVEEAKDYYGKLAQEVKGDKRPGIVAEKALIRMERGDSRPFLGLGFSFTESMKGVPIVTVFKNGPCEAAGVRRNDVLLAIDSQPTPNARSVIKIIGWEKNIGDKVTLLIRRRGEREVIESRIERVGGKEIEVPVRFEFKPKEIEIPVTLTETPEKLER